MFVGYFPQDWLIPLICAVILFTFAGLNLGKICQDARGFWLPLLIAVTAISGSLSYKFDDHFLHKLENKETLPLPIKTCAPLERYLRDRPSHLGPTISEWRKRIETPECKTYASLTMIISILFACLTCTFLTATLWVMWKRLSIPHQLMRDTQRQKKSGALNNECTAPHAQKSADSESSISPDNSDEEENMASRQPKKISALVSIGPEHRRNSLSENEEEFMQLCCESFTSEIFKETFKEGEREPRKERKKWDCYIFLQFVKDRFGIKGDSTTPTGYLLCDQFKGKKSTTGIPLEWDTFTYTIARGISEEITEKILEHATACKGLTLGELLRDFANYYSENGHQEFFHIGCKNLLGENSQNKHQ